MLCAKIRTAASAGAVRRAAAEQIGLGPSGVMVEVPAEVPVEFLELAVLVQLVHGRLARRVEQVVPAGTAGSGWCFVQAPTRSATTNLTPRAMT